MPSFLGHPRATKIVVQAPVYATWNRAGTNPNVTLSKWNLVAELTGSPPATAYGVSATTGYNFDDGKRYVEVLIDNIAGFSSGITLGFCDNDQIFGDDLGNLQYAYGWRADGYKVSNGVASSLGSVASNGALLQMAIHAYNEFGVAKANIWFGLNGTWLGGGSPDGGDFPAFAGAVSPLATDWAIRATMKATGDRIVANFGGSPFFYPIPLGFGSGWGANII